MKTDSTDKAREGLLALNWKPGRGSIYAGQLKIMQADILIRLGFVPSFVSLLTAMRAIEGEPR